MTRSGGGCDSETETSRVISDDFQMQEKCLSRLKASFVVQKTPFAEFFCFKVIHYHLNDRFYSFQDNLLKQQGYIINTVGIQKQ